MSGICGVISKVGIFNDKIQPSIVLQSMLARLGQENQSQGHAESLPDCAFGVLSKVSQKSEKLKVYNRDLDILCIIDGQVYIDKSTKELIRKSYTISSELDEIEYLPYLYSYYKSGYIKHVGGCFNIFLFDRRNNMKILSNDRLGLLPLFCYETDSVFVFASKIESVLSSGLIPQITFDSVTIAETLLFNYPLSSNTLIENIYTLPSALNYFFTSATTKEKYWNPGELIVSAPLNKSTSLDLIDNSLKNSIEKPLSSINGKLFVTLTGGLDGRLVSSYILPEYSDRVTAFSFGSETSPDILIPEYISRNEGFKYTPFILDQNYLDNSFIDAAFLTIKNSNGSRSYRRAHYIYAAQKLASESELVISGNFGDEVLKFSGIKSSEVISKKLIELIDDKFVLKRDYFVNSGISDLSVFFNKSDKDELHSRLENISKNVDECKSGSEVFHNLKMTTIASRYFGAEINSYNDYINNFSPFLDFEFLSDFSKTCFSGLYYPFNSNQLRHKEMSLNLYTELIKRNYKDLNIYKTDKGIYPADSLKITGKISILYNKVIRKRSNSDNPYFLNNTDTLVLKYCKNMGKRTGSFGPVVDYVLDYSPENQTPNDKILSLQYWLNSIIANYNL